MTYIHLRYHNIHDVHTSSIYYDISHANIMYIMIYHMLHIKRYVSHDIYPTLWSFATLSVIDMWNVYDIFHVRVHQIIHIKPYVSHDIHHMIICKPLNKEMSMTYSTSVYIVCVHAYHMYMYACMYIYIYTYTYIYIYIYMNIYINIHTYIHSHIYIYT
jgi:hypothetical protein